jgi:hypothetical protein
LIGQQYVTLKKGKDEYPPAQKSRRIVVGIFLLENQK